MAAPVTSSSQSSSSRTVAFPGSSTSQTGRAVVAQAARAVDTALAERVEGARDWRSEYVACLRDLTAASGVSSQAALAMARAGLAGARERIRLGDRPLAEASPLPRADRLGSLAVRGEGSPIRDLVVPYRGRELRGEALLAQVEAWVEAGVAEPSFADAITAVVEHPEWLGLPGRTVAVIGAGSEMGPLRPLLAWGADVLAIDLPSEPIWQRVTGWARERAGTLRLPVAGREQGADLVRDLPAVRAWLDEAAGDTPLVLGTYAYADGGAHVLVTMAADALAVSLLDERPGTALAWLATPTDAFLVPEQVAATAADAWPRRSRAGRIARTLSGGRLFAPGYGTPRVADTLVPQQGPNYALAKRLQRWRGIAAEADGALVSFNVAPATLTRSVTKNRVLAAAYGGAHHFGVEVFRPETTRPLMAALLVHDLCAPATRREHPEDLFAAGALHGGLWRTPYDPRSVLGVAAVAGLHRALRP